MTTVTVTVHDTEFDLEAKIDSIQGAEPDVGIMSSYVEDYSLYWADFTPIPSRLEDLILSIDGQDDKIREILNRNHDDYYGEAYNG